MSGEGAGLGTPRTGATRDRTSKPESIAGDVPRADPAVIARRKQRFLELLRIFAQRGQLTPEEVDEALGRSTSPCLLMEVESLRQRVVDLNAERRWSDGTREFLEDEVSALEAALRDEAQRAKESTDRIAYLEGQLRTARRTAIRLINASETSLATVKQVRSDLAVENPPQDVLDPLVHSLEQVVSTVQDLEGLARETKVRPPPQIPSR